MNLSGHAALVIKKQMYVFFGYSPDVYYTNVVQIFDFGGRSEYS